MEGGAAAESLAAARARSADACVLCAWRKFSVVHLLVHLQRVHGRILHCPP